MATPRLTALGALVIGVGLAILVPDVPGLGVAALVGWIAVALLALGLVAGEPTAVVFAAALFVIRATMVSAVTGPLIPPAWVQVLLLVLVVELAAVSLEGRTRPRSLAAAIGGVAVSGLIALLTAIALEPAVYGSGGGGILLRIAAIAALVLAAGWVMSLWHRALTDS